MKVHKFMHQSGAINNNQLMWFGECPLTNKDSDGDEECAIKGESTKKYNVLTTTDQFVYI